VFAVEKVSLLPVCFLDFFLAKVPLLWFRLALRFDDALATLPLRSAAPGPGWSTSVARPAMAAAALAKSVYPALALRRLTVREMVPSTLRWILLEDMVLISDRLLLVRSDFSGLSARDWLLTRLLGSWWELEVG
jgi:hypothetical protein